MPKRKKRAPEVLYSALEEVRVHDGLVHIAVRSGAHIERGAIPLRMAMELYDRLGQALSRSAVVHCLACEHRVGA